MISSRHAFPPTLAGAQEALQRVWGYDSLRPAQQDVIASYVEGQDILAILPTGGGKSLLYQVPALLGEGLVVVISPLIALMQDQVAGLARRGVAAVALNSTMRRRQIEQALIDARYGKYKILYLAPERLTTEAFQSIAADLPVKLLAVDEAHCVSEWAPHFRPEYRLIGEARDALGSPPLLAVTATATPEVRRDIEALLGLRTPRVIVRGFDRPNLTFTVLREDNKRARVLRVLGRVKGSGIVYASTRRDVEEWAAWLNAQGHVSARYHGGMDAQSRRSSLDAWMSGTHPLMVATNAFGMGIDKPDVRFVVHVDVPGSIEAYYQEAGRGGRDGAAAHAVLLWQPRDLDTQRTLIAHGHPTAAQLATIFDAMGNLAQVPLGTVPDQPIHVQLSRVATLVGVSEGLVRSAVEVLERAEALAQEVPWGDGSFRWKGGRDAILQSTSGALAGFTERLMRVLPTEAFRVPVDVSISELSRKLRFPSERLERGLAYLEARGLAHWQRHEDALRLTLRVPRTSRLVVKDAWLEKARTAAERRLAYLERYLAAPVCRRRYVLGYFGESAPDRCGRCDVCLGQRSLNGPGANDRPLLAEILHSIEREGRTGLLEAGDFRRIPGLMTWLVQEEYIQPDDLLAQTYRLTPDGARYLRRLSPAAS